MSTSTAITVIARAKVAHLNDLHRRCEMHKGTALELALEAGAALLAIKAQLRHGELGPWLADHFEGSDRTARAYMQLASAPEPNRQAAADLTIEGALEQVARPRRMSAGEIGNVFALAAGGEPALREIPAPALFTDQQERKDRRAIELIQDAQSAQHEVHRAGLGRSAVARSYRDAARAAQRAAVLLDELALSFER